MTSISKMKKHPIDELFQQNLQDFEVKPSENLRDKFLQSLEEEPKKKGGFIIWRPYFAAAASILLLLGIGWTVFNLGIENPKTNGEMAQQSTAPDMEAKEDSPSAIVEPLQQEAPIAAVPKESSKVRNSTKSETSTVSIAEPEVATLKPTKALPEISITGATEIDERIPDELTLALESSVTKEKELMAEANEESKEGLFTKSAGETIIIVTSDFEREEKILLPEINADSQLSLAEVTELGEERMIENGTFISKVVTEFKHLKHGEKVTFQQIDEHIDQTYSEDTFIGHEAREFRQRVNWLKERLSK
ncbi:hypothetical protein [Jiulongibacter sp. NS-SX5]|uniref:hypothetical protein n=1 Tax=Jiulongibacter sp. NS-SX5 TaxID=3463854 RepID=UPI004059E928